MNKIIQVRLTLNFALVDFCMKLEVTTLWLLNQTFNHIANKSSFFSLFLQSVGENYD